MTLTYKRIIFLLFLMVNAAFASAQDDFFVEEISKYEYVQAEKKSSLYNTFSIDSIPNTEIMSMVLKESQNKFNQLDSTLQQDKYDYYGERFCIDQQRLLFFPKLKLYGCAIPEDPFNDIVWWFDAESGKYLCEAELPTAVNTNGIYVSLIGYDCDAPLDLKFFQRDGNCISEFKSYKNSRYDGEVVFYPDEDNELRSIFWYDNNVLFLKTYDRQRAKSVFLKITLK